MEVKIYKLCDPRDAAQLPKYIGITSKTLKKRFTEHLNSYFLSVKKTHKVNWINKLLKEGITPIIIEIESTDSWELACQREIYWIKYYRELGIKLTITSTSSPNISGGHLVEEFS